MGIPVARDHGNSMAVAGQRIDQVPAHKTCATEDANFSLCAHLTVRCVGYVFAVLTVRLAVRPRVLRCLLSVTIEAKYSRRRQMFIETYSEKCRLYY